MGDAKRLIVKPISSKDANRIVQSLHYSGKTVQNSQLHLGVFFDGKCGGAMQFGPSTDKRRMLGLVRGTLWNEFIELNRMAFADWLPRNGESRAIGYAFRLMRKQYPQIKWCVSFADGTQCGDGTIYRASGFDLIGIKENVSLLQMPDGSVVSDKTLNNSNYKVKGQSAGYWKKRGATALLGFQLKYIYFLDPTARQRLTVPILPFSEIDRRGAGMYKGKPRVRSVDGDTSAIHAEEGGSTPTRTLLAESKPNGHTGDEDGSTSNNPAVADDSGTPPGRDSTPTANRRKSKKQTPRSHSGGKSTNSGGGAERIG